MKNLKQLREERAALVARAQAIIDIAKTENRDLSEAEKAEVDGIVNKGGLVDVLSAEIERIENVEQRAAEIAVQNAGKEFEANSPTRIEPIAYNGPLHGYASEKDAYVAGKWAAATILNHAPSAQWCREHGVPTNAHSEGVNTKGGSLVIPQIETAVISLFETYNQFYANADRVSMASSEYRFVSQTDELTATFVPEVPSTSAPASDLNFRTHTLNAKPIQAFTYVSMDLNADAVINVGNEVASQMALAFSKKMDQCGFIGDGTSTYGGIVGLRSALAAGSIHTAAAGNTAFSTLDDQDFLDMMGKLPDYARPGAKWYISREGYFASMARLLRAGGGNTVADLGAGPVLQYAGIPVVLTRNTNTTLTTQTSTTGLCYLGDLAMAAKIGIRSGMEMMVYRELYARNRQIGLEATMRFDIAVHQTGTANAAGAILALATPGS
jgi:HK97 family phage major capsid protein